MDRNVENILSVFQQATPDEVKAGLNWYFDANAIARNLTHKFHVPVPKTAGLLAVLSPNQRWSNTVQAAERVLEGYTTGRAADEVTVPTYPKNKEKAWKLLSGSDRAEVLRGPKVQSFYANIVSPWTSTSVTIDGHAYNVWNGTRESLKDGRIPDLDKAGRYKTISQDYRTAAEELNLKPWQVQAVTWVTWRRLHEIW